MTTTYESSPLRPKPMRCPRCGRKRWLTVTVQGKEHKCSCASCGHAWRVK